jgi:hypothetical protein
MMRRCSVALPILALVCGLTGRARPFAANADGTVIDRATGLMWQQTDGGEMTWESARSYCAGLELAGHRDWRLPKPYESLSILDHTLRPPALDPAFFSRSGAQYWWTSVSRADDPSRVWVTNAGGGLGPHPKNETISAGGDRKVHARCVRGSEPATQGLTGNKDGSVTDRRTGLIWRRQGSPAAFAWEDARRFCATPWRLPDINELQSINDDTAVRPSVNRTMFPDTAQAQYWSSTSMANRPERAWTVDFTFGIVSYEDKTEKLNARCVREAAAMTQILGRPTGRSITVSVLAAVELEVFFEYGVAPGAYKATTSAMRSQPGKPLDVLLEPLQPNTRYYYRMRHRRPGEGGYSAGVEYSFQTQRAPGSAFTFGVQGDSHPERRNTMYDPDLYVRTMQNVERDRPDFYITLGDDFSVDPLYNRGNLNAGSVAQLYINQRRFLGLMGHSTALFLVNGNHEQAAAIHLNGTPDNPAIYAGKARNLYFPLPVPDAFYGGDTEPVEFLGLRRDYYAWTWGDALFVAIDPYWHSPVLVDAPIGGGEGQQDGLGGRKGEKKGGQKGAGKSGGRNRDGWAITMGDAQYHWLEKMLTESKSRYKFVFTHHVSGTGRGAIEVSDLWEWGGKNRAGEWEFDKKRPGWAMPVHQLMVKNGVTIFFQGHDHLFARQERDGVVYQETPNPADAGYNIFNREAYRSGDILPNSGYLRVTVSPANVKVDYIRAYLPQDEKPDHKNGEIAFSYSVAGGKPAR